MSQETKTSVTFSCSFLQKILRAVEFVEKLNFDFTTNGIVLQAMDASKISLLLLEFVGKKLKHYSCKNSRTICFRCSDFQKILTWSQKNDLVTLNVETNSIDVQLSNPNDDGRTAAFELRIFEENEDRFIIPQMEYDAQIKMCSDEFKSTVGGLKNIDEAVRDLVNITL